jgi:hypothetical protein
MITMTLSRWPSLSEIFTAQDLMTPWEQLLVHDLDQQDELKSYATQPYDIIPVVKNGRITAILEKGSPEFQPLLDRWLISRDTSIPDLVNLFTATRQTAFLVFHKQDVIGLVSPADLNKLPARVFIYNLIGELELGLAYLIGSHFNDESDSLIKLLSTDRQKELHEIRKDLVSGNADVELLQQMYLSELINIIAKQPELRKSLGFSSRKSAENYLNGLNSLRDQTMHFVRPLLQNIPADLEKLHERIKRVEEILARLPGANLA